MTLLGLLIGAIGVGLCGADIGVRLFRRRKKKQVEEQWAPRPVDPNNPPHYMKYSPKPGRAALRCTNAACFQTLTPGDRVLMWPLAGGAYDLLCPACWKVRDQ